MGLRCERRSLKLWFWWCLVRKMEDDGGRWLKGFVCGGGAILSGGWFEVRKTSDGKEVWGKL